MCPFVIDQQQMGAAKNGLQQLNELHCNYRQPRIILVCHCYRGDGEVVRIISARIATREESKSYLAGAH